MTEVSETHIECAACLAYRALSPGHPYLIKYTANIAIHTPRTREDGAQTCTISNLCEEHTPETFPQVPTTAPGTPCQLQANCSINTTA